jgi:hypothetical protein
MQLPKCVVGAAALLAVLTAVAAPPAVQVSFAPRVQQELNDRFGTDQEQVLREQLRQALDPQLTRVGLPPGARVLVTLEQVQPTHPTPRQSADNPSLDPFATKFLGGAKLRGIIQDADGHALATVPYSHYAQTLRLGSASKDPWADARLAFEGFASRLVGALPAQTAVH